MGLPPGEDAHAGPEGAVSAAPLLRAAADVVEGGEVGQVGSAGRRRGRVSVEGGVLDCCRASSSG